MVGEKKQSFSGCVYVQAPTEGNEGNNMKDGNIEEGGIMDMIKKHALLIATLSGVFLGIVIGLSLRSMSLSADWISLLSYPGELYMRILKLIILPLIISSLIKSSAGMDVKLNWKITLRTLTYFFATSFLNAVLGIILAVIVRPGGDGSSVPQDFQVKNNRGQSLLDNIMDLGRYLSRISLILELLNFY
ncbi:hypothetical protein JTB14_031278 [Gonioctena quinquepunctata]|nr:hypothetical protein JTB14_031278 [Gonioctena quinquepunctata]